MGGGMRIDTTLMPQVPGLVTAPAQAGHTLSFDAFIKAPPGDDDAGTATRAAPVLSPYVFGFDALGLLGLGGPAGIGTPLKAASQDGTVQGASPLPQSVNAVRDPASPVYASVPYTALSSAQGQPVPAAASAPAPTAPAHIRAAMMPAGAGAASVWGTATPWRSASAGQAVRASNPIATPIASLPVASGVRGFGDAKDVPAARKAQAIFRFEPEADALSGQVSVTVSEGEDLLHIVAATPGLTEHDHLALRAVADEAAAEAGVKLGDLRLNGVVVRQLSRTR